MTDDDTGAPPARSGARDPNQERRSIAQTRTRARRSKSAHHEPADSSTTWQSPPTWLAGEEDAGTDGSADFGGDLVNLGFIGAALRRSRPFWLGLAILGVLIGVASWVMRPPMSSASTTLLLTVGPEAQPGTAILNDQAIAQSRGVAAIARQELGTRESIDSLLATYQTTVLTDRVLRITVTAPSSSQAVRRANAIASAFLTFRADQLRAQQRLQFVALDRVLTQSEQHLAAIDARLRQVSAQPESPSQKLKLLTLQSASKQARSELIVLKAQVNSAKATAQETTAAMIGQSKVLDAGSPVAGSRFKPLILSSSVGFIVGLVLGMGIVVIRALVSDRLRRRDDIARALGAPVRLSIAARPLLRRRPRRLGGSPVRNDDLEHIVEFLRSALPTESRRAALAVVPVDDTRVAAASLAALAKTMAARDVRLVVADLCDGAPAAKRLGVAEPGVRSVQAEGVRIEVAVPDSREITPVGPFGPPAPQDASAPDRQIAAACSSADVLLTLTTLDPAIAGDHLRSWAADAVVFVTAGRSSWTKIHAVGEMVRLAGTTLVSAVLVEADKWDESLGLAVRPDLGRAAKSPTGYAGSEPAATHSPTVSRFTS